MDKQILHHCQSCPRKFLNFARLMFHMKLIHKTKPTNKLRKLNGAGTKSRRCKVCHITFCGIYALKHHIQTSHHVHEKKAEIECPVCKKSFRRVAYLNTHIELAHEETKKHVCLKCNKRFGIKSNLKTHMKKCQ